MLRIIPPDGVGPILVFHKTYEATRLKELVERHPEFAATVDQYLHRIVDLRPLVEAGYYHPAMRGSFSIKAILPTVAPDLDYGELEEVQHGTAAQVAYLYAALEPTTTPARREALRRELLQYCRLDTWAMVEVAHFLERRPRPARPTGAEAPV
jgi:predicted RecB family nuclease